MAFSWKRCYSLFPSFSNTRKLVTVVLLLGAFQISKAAPVGDELNNSPLMPCRERRKLLFIPSVTRSCFASTRTSKQVTRQKSTWNCCNWPSLHPLPPNWKGTAKLYLSKGLLGIKGSDGTNVLFKFPTRKVPSGLAQQAAFTTYEIFGIGRFGSDTKLASPSVVANL